MQKVSCKLPQNGVPFRKPQYLSSKMFFPKKKQTTTTTFFGLETFLLLIYLIQISKFEGHVLKIRKSLEEVIFHSME